MPQNINNNSIVLAPPGAHSDVISAIKKASVETGVDFAYLLQEAKTESSLNPQAQAATSSARGLFQFIESTWLETMDRHGAKYGLDAEAEAITRDSKGRPVVKDPEQRAAILKLRENPHVSALMAGELAKDNEVVLERKLGREVSSAELYMAHFLGAGGAARFLASLEHNPDIEADYIVPAAARNNQAVFYKGGKALTLDQVYARFESKFEVPQPDYPEPDYTAPVPGLAPEQLLAQAAIPAAARPDLAALNTLAETVAPALGYPSGMPAPNRNLNIETLSLPDPRFANLATFQSQAMTMMALSALQALATDTDNNKEWIA